MDIVDELIRGREAFHRHEWRRPAIGCRRPTSQTLDPADLHALVTAAYLVGDIGDMRAGVAAAFQVHSDDGENLAAARDAMWLTMVLLKSGNEAAAQGWQARAARSLDVRAGRRRGARVPQDAAMFQQIFSGHFEEGFELAVAVAEAGRRHREPDLVAIGLVCQGRMLIYFGRVPDGLALLDEAMALVAAGEVSRSWPAGSTAR